MATAIAGTTPHVTKTLKIGTAAGNLDIQGI